MGRQRWEEHRAVHSVLSKAGLTVGDLRRFLDMVDSEEVSDSARVHVKEHVGEGGIVAATLEASSRHPVPPDDEAGARS